jgi:putative endonuclease
MNVYFVYIMASKRNGTLYVGVTNNLMKRVYEHRNDIIQGFTKKYSIHRLVYYEQTNDIYNAIQRETSLKKWNRKWKIKLIEKFNPNWDDLFEEVMGVIANVYFSVIPADC